MSQPEAQVQMLFTPGCAGCAQLRRMITRVLEEFPGLSWKEIDLIEHPELAGEYRIMSVPAVVIGGELAFTGVPKEQVFRERLEAYTRKEITT